MCVGLVKLRCCMMWMWFVRFWWMWVILWFLLLVMSVVWKFLFIVLIFIVLVRCCLVGIIQRLISVWSCVLCDFCFVSICVVWYLMSMCRLYSLLIMLKFSGVICQLSFGKICRKFLCVSCCSVWCSGVWLSCSFWVMLVLEKWLFGISVKLKIIVFICVQVCFVSEVVFCRLWGSVFMW